MRAAVVSALLEEVFLSLWSEQRLPIHFQTDRKASEAEEQRWENIQKETLWLLQWDSLNSRLKSETDDDTKKCNR